LGAGWRIDRGGELLLWRRRGRRWDDGGAARSWSDVVCLSGRFERASNSNGQWRPRFGE